MNNHIVYYTIDDYWPEAYDQGWDGPGWYFWDETDAYCYGPYESEEEAQKKLIEYAEKVLGP